MANRPEITNVIVFRYMGKYVYKFPNSKKERAPQLILRSCEDHICCPINRKIQKESVLASWISYPPMFPHLTIQPEIKLKAAPSGGKRKEA